MKISSLEAIRVSPRLTEIWATDVGQELTALARHAVLAGRLFEGRNLVISGTPGSGKSFVAEMAAVSSALRGRTVLLAQHGRAAKDLLTRIATRYAPIGLRVVGDVGPGAVPATDIRRGRYDVLVSSPERFTALIAQSPAVTDTVTAVVFDDPALLGRACGKVELLLTRLRDIQGEGPRIVVTTAAQGGLVEASRWLGAALVVHQQRHPDLLRGVLFEGRFHYIEPGAGQEGHEVVHPKINAEPVSLFAEAAESLLDKAETVALFLADAASAIQVATRLAPSCQRAEKSLACAAVKGLEPTSAQTLLLDLLPKGLAILHEELTGEEIQAVREASARKEIRCVLATHGMARRLMLPVSTVLVQGQRWERNKTGDDWRLTSLSRAELEVLSSWARVPSQESGYARAAVIATSSVEHEIFEERFLARELATLTGKLDAHNLEDVALYLVASGLAHSADEIVTVLSRTYSGATLWNGRRALASLAKRLDLALSACLASDLLAFGPNNRLVATPAGRVTVTHDLGLAAGAEIAHWNKEARGEVLSDLELLTTMALLPVARHRPFRRPSADPMTERPSRALLDRARAESLSSRPIFQRLSTARWTDSHAEEACGLALLLHDWSEEMSLRELERRHGVGAGGAVRMAEHFAELCESLAEIRADSHGTAEEVAQISTLAVRLRKGVQRDALAFLAVYDGPRGRAVVQRLRAQGFLHAERLRAASPEELFLVLNDEGLTNAIWAHLHPNTRLPRAALAKTSDSPETAALIAAVQVGSYEMKGSSIAPSLTDHADEAPTVPWLPKHEGNREVTSLDGGSRGKTLRLALKNGEIALGEGPPFTIPRVQFLVLAVLGGAPTRAFTAEALREGILALDADEDVPAMTRIRQLRYRIGQSLQKHLGAEAAATILASGGESRLQLGPDWQIEIVA